jgi:hypothetical protein
MLIIKKFKQNLENISKLPEKEFKFNLFGLFNRTVTANADTINEVLNSNEYVRCSLSRKIVHYVGARYSMVSQLDDRALLKKSINKKYYTDSKMIEKVFEKSITLIIEQMKKGGEIEMCSCIYQSLSSVMMEEILGIDFIEEVKFSSISTNESFSKLIFLNLLPLPMFVKDFFSPNTKAINDIAEKDVNFIYDNAICRENSLLKKLKDAENAFILSKKEVLGEIRAINIAANTLTLSILWSFYLLSKNPTHKEKVKTDNAYARWTYLESLRLLPPFFIISKEKKVSKCPFHSILPKKIITISIFNAHRVPEYWQDPLDFKPERFEKGLSNIKKGAFVPFGMGIRSCPGAALSIKIGPQIIQKLLQKFDIVLSREPVIKRRIELAPADNKMFFNIRDI